MKITFKKMENQMTHCRLLVVVLLIYLFVPFNIFSQCDIEDDPFHDRNRQRDFEAVQKFVNEKRMVTLRDKKEILEIYGDIRFEYLNRAESQDGRHLRGHDAVDSKGIHISKTHLDAVVNLRFDYRTERSWSHVNIEINNTCGIQRDITTCAEDPQGMFGSGFCDELCLKKCWLGYNLYECKDSFKIDIEFGRRPLYSVFESYIEFKNRFDGVLFKFKKKLKPSSELYLYFSPFVVDERVDHFAYIGEVGWLDVLDMKIDARYSLIDWRKHGRNRCGVLNARGNRFQISQVSAAYNFNPDVFHHNAKIYGAFLVNHAAKKLRVTRFHKENIGWYAGFIIGEVDKKGDWSLDINYQLVQAQAIPDSDINGIGRGNILGETFTANRRGKTNYRGWHFEALYALTDHLTFDILYEFSKAANPRIGGRHNYNKFEFDVILDF